MKCEKPTKVVFSFINHCQKKLSRGGEQKSSYSGQCENCPNARNNND